MITRKTKSKVPEILRLRNEGMYAPQIAKIVGLNAMTVYKVINQNKKTKKRGKVLNQKTFNAIKNLLELNGINQKDIANFVKRSPSTVCYVKRCETLDDYKELIRNIKKEKKVITPEEVDKVIETATVTLEDINDRLIRIEAKLDQSLIRTVKNFKLF